MKLTLDEIAEFYIQKGYSGTKLRYILEKDKTYQKLLKDRKAVLKHTHKVTKADSKKYLLSVDRDFKILSICKALEKMKIRKGDAELIKLIKSQLEEDWRSPLLKKLKEIKRRYK